MPVSQHSSQHASNSPFDEKDPRENRDHDRAISNLVANLNASGPAHTSAEAAALSGVQGVHDVEEGGTTVASSGPPPGAFDPRQNPDGGMQAWLCVVGCFCCLLCHSVRTRDSTPVNQILLILLCSTGWVKCIGIFHQYCQTHQLAAYPPSTVSWITSLAVFVNFALGSFIGAILDRDGHRSLLIIGKHGPVQSSLLDEIRFQTGHERMHDISTALGRCCWPPLVQPRFNDTCSAPRILQLPRPVDA